MEGSSHFSVMLGRPCLRGQGTGALSPSITKWTCRVQVLEYVVTRYLKQVVFSPAATSSLRATLPLPSTYQVVSALHPQPAVPLSLALAGRQVQ